MKLFVYGTLRTGGGKGLLSDHSNAKPLCPASINAKLYNCGWYPGVKLEKEGHTVGEIFEINDEYLIEQLHSYEGYFPDSPERSLFCLKTTTATCADGTEMEVNVYEYNKSIATRSEVESGDWFKK